MTSGRPGSFDHVPTLTEVVSVPAASPARTDGATATRERTPEPVPVEPTSSERAASEHAPEHAASERAVSEAVSTESTAGPAADAGVGADPARLRPSDEELTATILAGLQRQVDAVLEFRVRELLTPILNRATDAVVREAKNELARSLRDLVARSVAEEMRRQRLR